MPDNTIPNRPADAHAKTPLMSLEKWGGLASFLLAVAFVVPPLIHLFGDLQAAFGPMTYDLADFLHGPVWAASLTMAVVALREVMGKHAPRRMLLALLLAVLAAGAMVAVACIRSANRHYHLSHPELNLETSTEVLVVWTTIVAGLNAAGWQFLGWTLVLIGSTGWTSRRLPRLLSVLYIVGGTASLFVFLRPGIEEIAVLLAVVLTIWQGILLWKAEPA